MRSPDPPPLIPHGLPSSNFFPNLTPPRICPSAASLSQPEGQRSRPGGQNCTRGPSRHALLGDEGWAASLVPGGETEGESLSGWSNEA